MVSFPFMGTLCCDPNGRWREREARSIPSKFQHQRAAGIVFSAFSHLNNAIKIDINFNITHINGETSSKPARRRLESCYKIKCLESLRYLCDMDKS